MLSEQHAQHFMSVEERQKFERDGYFIIDDVLRNDEIALYTALINAIYEQHYKLFSILTSTRRCTLISHSFIPIFCAATKPSLICWIVLGCFQRCSIRS